MSEKFSFNFSCPAFDPREAKELGLKEEHDRVYLILRQLTEIFLANSSTCFLFKFYKLQSDLFSNNVFED